jgi:hypothetical protein
MEHFDNQDYEAAMLCAIEHHWIKVENGVTRLTESGSVVAGSE